MAFKVNSHNESPIWTFLNSDLPYLDSLLMYVLPDQEEISAVRTKRLTINSAFVTTAERLRPTMVLTYTHLRFTAFSVLFVGVAGSASFVILPLLLLSFVFSGFVLLFTGLSYSSFRIASSQYNHTVLFLNKILRKIADSIPPSVGYAEVKPLKIGRHTSFLPSFKITSRIRSVASGFSGIMTKLNPFKASAPEVNVKTAAAASSLLAGPAQVIIDEEGDDTVLDAYLKTGQLETVPEEVTGVCKSDPAVVSTVKDEPLSKVEDVVIPAKFSELGDN
jgi:hypothetical protein